MSGYERLAEAIVLCAVKDYRRAITKLAKYPEDNALLETKQECEKFFKSDWCKMLTTIDGETIISEINMRISQ